MEEAAEAAAEEEEEDEAERATMAAAAATAAAVRLGDAAMIPEAVVLAPPALPFPVLPPAPLRAAALGLRAEAGTAQTMGAVTAWGRGEPGADGGDVEGRGAADDDDDDSDGRRCAARGGVVLCGVAGRDPAPFLEGGVAGGGVIGNCA